MPNLKKINPSELQLGMMFSMPVFFDDGKYMFLAKNRTVKKYHLNAVNQWKIPFLLTAGSVVTCSEENDRAFASFAKGGDFSDSSIDEVEELEEIDEVEEL